MSPTAPPREARPPADQATRERISRTALDATLFVEAGAGTGKTSQLVERIAELVLRTGVRMSSIAAITFTEAAAAELSARVRVRFERELATADGELADRCLTALADLDLAAVSTLHGFASRILGEFAVAAGLPPRVHVLDDIASQLAHEQRWERFVDGLYDDPAHEALLTRATVLDIRLEPTYPGEATFKEVAAHLGQHWDRLEAFASEPLPPIGPVDFTAFDTAVADMAALPGRCADPDDPLLVRLRAILPHYLGVATTADHDRKLRLVRGLKEQRVARTGRKPSWRGEVESARATIGRVNAAVSEVVGAATDATLRHLLALTARHVLDAALTRRAEGGLEFHDLLVLSRDLLRTSPEARRRLHDRFTHILLDEFQDTDPLQIELASLIAAEPEAEATSWSELPVAPGRLFFVGDPKQSIYRFRRADIELFLAARDHVAPDGGWERLTTNFRTVGPILEWVNELFGDLMPEELPGAQPGYQPLIAHRQVPPGPDHRPVLLGGPHPDPKVRAPALRDAEALDVARLVVDIERRPEAWPVHDADGTWRPARLSDITILVPTRTSLPFLRQALDDAGLGYRLATGTLVYDTQEVRDLLAALRAVDDPTDTLATVAALRSPLYACSDVDLHRFHEAGGRFDLRVDPPDTVPPDHPVHRALHHLRSLWHDRWWSSPSALLDRLIAERHARGLAFGDPRPADVWRRLRFLADQARGFEETSTEGLRAFLDWADLQRAEGARVHEPLLPETDDTTVRIMTIHAAKGLEFPITILTGTTTARAGRRSGPSVLWSGDDRPEVSMSSSARTREFAPRADVEDWMDEHEKLRLLYVALTRARDHLVVSCHHKAGSACYGRTVWDTSSTRDTLWRAAPPAEPAPEPAVVVAASGQLSLPLVAAAPADLSRSAWIGRRRALADAVRPPRVVSATALAAHADLPDPVLPRDDVVLPHVDLVGLPDPVPAVPTDLVDGDLPDSDLVDLELSAHDDAGAGIVRPRRRGRAGSAIGRAVHATLQALDLAAPGDIERQVRRQCDLEAVPDLADTAAAMVRSALASEALGLARRYPHHKELLVAAPVADRVVEGYVDLLVETPDGLVIIDYKTDTVSSEAEVAAKLAVYERQGAAYALALEIVTGQPVAACHFVFARPRGAIERQVAHLPERVAELRARLAT